MFDRDAALSAAHAADASLVVGSSGERHESKWGRVIRAAVAEIDRLAAENAGLRRDAEHWRSEYIRAGLQ